MAKKNTAERARRKAEKEKRRRKRLADRERQSRVGSGDEGHEHVHGPDCEHGHDHGPSRPRAAPERAAPPRGAAGKRPDLGPAGALVDPATFSGKLMDREASNVLIDRLVKLLESEEELVSLRFDALTLREADAAAKLEEIETEDDAERQAEALRRVIPHLVTEKFRRATRTAIDRTAGGLVASIAPDRVAQAEALALGVLLAQGRTDEPLAANPLWRAIAVLSYQEAGALQEYAHHVRTAAEKGEGEGEGGGEGGDADVAATAKAGLPEGSLDRAIGRVYRDRFEGAQDAVRRGEVARFPLYRLLHLTRAYGRGLRRANVASQFGVPPDRFYEWLGDKLTECAPKDLDGDFLGRCAESLLQAAREATDANDTTRAKRLLDAHGFMEGAASAEVEIAENPLVRFHYFESLQGLLGEAEGGPAEAGGEADGPGTDAEHARAIVSDPDGADALRQYAEALRERGEAEAASRVDAFVDSEL